MMKHTAANSIKQTQESPDWRGFHGCDASYCITLTCNQPLEATVHITAHTPRFKGINPEDSIKTDAYG